MAAPLIILEGADASGKSTLAAQLQEAIPNAYYVHMSDHSNVKKGLCRMYVEAIMPAVLGHRPVIMDRCWLSEEPYCRAFRPNEAPRHDDADNRMLERLALTCDPLVVFCDPGWETIKKHFVERKGLDPDSEYLDNAFQLQVVRSYYPKGLLRSHLPAVRYNWQKDTGMLAALVDRVESKMASCAQISDIQGIGSYNAQVMVVGDEFAKHQEFDPLYQWPFASFSNHGCSRWFATQLDKYKVPEDKLWWVNQDQLTHERDVIDILDHLEIHSIVCLGEKATDKVRGFLRQTEQGMVDSFPHPAWWKRFNVQEDYIVARRLKELTDG